MATQFQRSPPEGFSCRRMPLLHPEYEAILYHSGSSVTTKFQDIIYTQVFSTDLALTIQKKTGWTPRQFDCISWKAYDAAFPANTLFRRISIAKLSHDLWNTGAQKKLFGQDDTGHCPVCKVEVETMDHVFQCSHSEMVTLKTHLLSTFEDELHQIGTPRAIRDSIMAGLQWWMLQEGTGACPKAPGFGSLAPSAVWSTNAYAEQTSLGWGQLLRGRISNLWGEAYVKETRSGCPKESQEKWTKQVIGLLWKIAFSLWGNRNGVLHGVTFAQQRTKAQEDLFSRIRDLYALHKGSTFIVYPSAQYLFDKSLDSMLLKGRQYLLCWVRSVEAAITFQEQETDSLRQQASRYFPVLHPPQAATETSKAPVRITNLREVDITSPSRYNLRQHRVRCSENPLSVDSEESLIPPAMFEDRLDSSYVCSGQKDLHFRADSSIATNELAQLASDIDTLSIDHSASFLDSDYSGSNGVDVLFRPDATISTAELEALGSTFASSTGGFSPRDTSDLSLDSSLSPGEQALLRQLHMSSTIETTFSIAEASFEPARRSRNAGLPSINEEQLETPQCLDSTALSDPLPSGGTVSTLASNEWRIPFPLRQIGAVYKVEDSASPARNYLGINNSPAASTAPVLTVYGEIVPDTAPEFYIPMRQPSATEHSTTSESSFSGSFDSVARPLDDQTILALVRRAQQWLYTYQPSNRDIPLSSSIYWYVRSLPTFYAAEIRRAERMGAPLLKDIDDDEWPPPLTGGETYDWSGIPDWLCVLVNMDNLHDWGLHGIRTRETGLRGATSVERGFLLRDLYVEEIPQRELDDPADLRVFEDTGDSRTSGIIEELTNTNEDLSSRST
mmetsp:Transcript_7588/g.11005  ORF Transcript_7588/g.11005 Transcript_7588/m.11005 type:complete len:844 (+) Transcript_7588:228-2759(+)